MPLLSALRNKNPFLKIEFSLALALICVYFKIKEYSIAATCAVTYKIKQINEDMAP